MTEATILQALHTISCISKWFIIINGAEITTAADNIDSQ
jgi:hypothetical protein